MALFTCCNRAHRAYVKYSRILAGLATAPDTPRTRLRRRVLAELAQSANDQADTLF